MFFLLNAGFTVILAILFYNFYWKRRKLPPGPIPLPVFGNVLSLTKSACCEQQFNKWAKSYGPIYTFWLGELPVVIVTDYPLIMEMFVKDGDTYIDRQAFKEFDKLVKGGTYGVIQTEGDLWRDQRRFALHVFRDFGVGKNLMEEKILTEIADRFKTLDRGLAKSDVVEVDEMLDVAIGSIINDLLFGFRFDDEHLVEFRNLKRIVSSLIQSSGRPQQQIISQFPVLRRLPYVNGVFKEIYGHFRDLQVFYKHHINAHAKDINFEDLDAPASDYVEAFLKEKRRRDLSGEVGHYYTMDQLVNMCFDLWLAGQETTATSLAWGVAHILHNPNVQSRLHAELDTVIGDAGRMVTLADKPKLPYTNAVINEIQRTANLVPINVLRRTTRDVTVRGHFLPKGTCIIPQVCAVLHDDRYFPNTVHFDPERYLTEDGKLAKCDQLIPFSVGKRQCLGEPLARMELFLFTANIFNRYELRPADAGPPSLKRTLGGTIACPKFKCRAALRLQTSSNHTDGSH